MPARAVRTPQELWAGYDPRSRPLEIETIRRWSAEGANYHEFYFTGEVYQGQKVRIYAIYAAPKEGKDLPAVLHIHGGGQTVCLPWLRFWNRRGYAAMTFNWGGKWPNRQRYALWGKLKQGDHKYAGKKLNAVRPTPRESSWYHWTLVSRRALTVLERQKEVDPKRLGIFGISMGGTIVWSVAGTDRRVKAACAIYGVGWNSYPPSKYEKDPKAKDSDTRTWRRTMAPEAYAPLIQCPVLFLSGTNDFHGKMDWAYDTLALMKAPSAAAFTPQYNHHVARAQGQDLPLWMETYLRGAPAWPKPPKAAVSLDARGVPRLTVRPDLSQEIKRVEAFYALENADPKNRYWRPVTLRRKDRAWTASLPVLDARKRLFAFAQADYERGMCLAGNFLAVVPAELGPAEATDTPSLQIGDFARNLDGFHTTSTGTDPVIYYRGLVRKLGPDGRFGVHTVTGAAIMTRKLGDPKWRGPEGAKLTFEVYSPHAVTLRISLKYNESNPGARTYQTSLSLRGGKGWHTVRLERGRFKATKGPALRRWRDVQTLEIASDKWPKPRPLFANFRWAEAGKQAPGTTQKKG